MRGAGAGQEKGLALGLELSPEAVRLQFAGRRQNSKHALHCTASPKGGRNKEQEEHGAGSDLPASSRHRTLGFVVRALCFLSRFSQKAEFHAKPHIRSHWQRPAGSDLYVERLCLSESARGVISLPF